MNNNNESDILSVYNLEKGLIKEVEIDIVKHIIGRSLKPKLLRKIFLRNYASKFVGFLLNDETISDIFSSTSILNKIIKEISEIKKKYNYKTYNKAFTHRRESRILYPKDHEVNRALSNKMFCSPADGYLNIRDIKNNSVEIFPELSLSISKMIGIKNSHLFKNGGKLLLFTMKYFHDHTLDYPLDSKVLENPYDYGLNNKNIYSTDLNFVNFMSNYYGNSIYDENHRVVTKLFADKYREEYIFIEVGSVNVNSVEQDNCSTGKSYKKGIQKSHFNFGSSVILLLPKSFEKKIYFPNVLKQNTNTSVSIKRGNVIAIPLECPHNSIFSIAKNVRIAVKRNSAGNIYDEIIYL